MSIHPRARRSCEKLTAMPDVVMCNTEGCGHEFGPYPTGWESPGDRAACPKCGGAGRVLKQAPASASATYRTSASYEARPPGRTSNRSRFAWGFGGWDYSRRLGRHVLKVTHFDKRSDRRFEHVEDPTTGEVLHHEDHPLTEHRGHGSDRLSYQAISGNARNAENPNSDEQ